MAIERESLPELITRAERLFKISAEITKHAETLGTEQGPERLNYRVMNGGNRSEIMISVGSMRRKIATVVLPNLERKQNEILEQLEPQIDVMVQERFRIDEIRQLNADGYLPADALELVEQDMSEFKQDLQSDYRRGLITRQEFIFEMYNKLSGRRPIETISGEVSIVATFDTGIQIPVKPEIPSTEPTEVTQVLLKPIQADETFVLSFDEDESEFVGSKLEEEKLPLSIINRRNREITRNGEVIKFTDLQWDTLMVVIQAGDSGILTKDLGRIIKKNHPNSVSNIGVHVQSLRRKLERDETDPKFIISDVAGINTRYFFKGEVKFASSRIVIFEEQNKILVDNREIELTAEEMKLLKVLVGNPGEIVTSRVLSTKSLGIEDPVVARISLKMTKLAKKINYPYGDKLIYSKMASMNSGYKLQNVNLATEEDKEKETVVSTAVAPEQLPATPMDVIPEIPVEIVSALQAPEAGILIDPGKIKEDPSMIQFLESLQEPAKILIEKFFESDYVPWLLAQIKKFQPDNEIEKKNFMQELAGQIFEQLGCLHFTQVFGDPDMFVLSPQEAIELYKEVYPDRKFSKIRKNSLNSGIEGVTVPDGLVIKNTGSSLAITGVIDYKLWARLIPRPEEFQKQLENYRYPLFIKGFWLGEGSRDPLLYGKLINKLRPEIPVKPLSINPEYKVIYGLPKNSSVKFPADGIETKYIPVDSRILGIFNDLLFDIVKNRYVIPLEEDFGRIITSFDESEFVEPTTELENIFILPDGQKVNNLSKQARQFVEFLKMLLEDRGMEEPLPKTAHIDSVIRELWFDDIDEINEDDIKAAKNRLGVLKTYVNKKLAEKNWKVVLVNDFIFEKAQEFTRPPKPGEVLYYTLMEIKPIGRENENGIERTRMYVKNIKSLIERGGVASPEHLQRAKGIAERFGIAFEQRLEEKGS